MYPNLYSIKKYLLLALCIMLSLQLVQAQQRLLIKKYGGSRSYEFLAGESLRLKLKSSGEVLQGNWQYAGENSLHLAGQRIDLSDIRWIDVSEKEKGVWVLRKGQDLLLIAGLGYFTVAHVNIPIETGELAVDREVARVSAGMLAGGLICTALDRLLHRRKVAVGSRRFTIAIIE